MEFNSHLFAIFVSIYSVTLSTSHASANGSIPDAAYKLLAQNEKQLFRGRLQCFVREKWSSGRDAKRIETYYFFSKSDGLDCFIKSNYGANGSSPSFNETDEARAALGHFDDHPFIVNTQYAAMLRKGPRGFSLSGSPTRFGDTERVGFMAPYNVPHPKLFNSMFGFKLRELLESSYVSNVATAVDREMLRVSAHVRVERQFSPWHEDLDGAWEATIDQKMGLIVHQSYTGKDTQFSVSCSGDFPSSLRLETKLSVQPENITIEYVYKTVSFQQNNEKPVEACYLSYYGLPEPPGVNKPRSWTWYLGPLVVAIVVAGVFWMFWGRKK